MAMASANSTASENSVQTELVKFLRLHNLHDYVSDIDEIVLNYVISILEDLGESQNAEENIDVDQFIEMMDAYIPGFASIDSIKVYDWMFEIAASLSKSSVGCKTTEEPTSPTLNAELMLGACKLQDTSTQGQSRNRNQSSTGEDSERTSSESSADDIDEQLEQLIEMFPNTVQFELSHCLRGSEGDMERAVQLILHRQDSGEAFTENKKPRQKPTHLDEKKEKQKFMERYAFIDVDEDKKEFKPAAPKGQPKKMIRYLDGQVVNTKGQRFTELKKDDTEEMKKTFINLKPARKYRFH